jgi:hypothetical protein
MFHAGGLIGTVELLDALSEQLPLEAEGEHRHSHYILPAWLRCLGASSPERNVCSRCSLQACTRSALLVISSISAWEQLRRT